MKQPLLGKGFMAGALFGACLFVNASAQNAPISPSSPPNATTTQATQNQSVQAAASPAQLDDGKTASDTSSPAKHSAAVDEVLKMMQAGVSVEVIKAYIENAPIGSLNATDIITLKENRVPDDLTTALLKRSSALRTQVSQAPNLNAKLPQVSSSNRRYHLLDPESYDYFQYYYLYPRTLAAANQRLYSINPSSYGFRPYPYGFYGPRPFHPLPPSALRRH